MRTYALFVGLAFVGIIYFMYKYFAKKASTSVPPVPNIPDNGVNIPIGYLVTATNIAQQVFDVTDGLFKWAARKESVFVTLINLTDDQLVYVYTVYNNRFFATYNESMTKSIKSEYNVTLGGVRDKLVSRLIGLGCTI